jgi:hypothetical protein
MVYPLTPSPLGRGKHPSYSRSESTPLGRRGWERKPAVFFPSRKSFNFFYHSGVRDSGCPAVAGVSLILAFSLREKEKTID